ARHGLQGPPRELPRAREARQDRPRRPPHQGQEVMSRFSISNLTRSRIPRFDFIGAARAALPGWDISLVFAGPTQAQRLNKQLRKKSYVPNVLSYAAGAANGEIIICPAVARKQAPGYGLSAGDFTALLFIHGLLHLKGMAHGTTM